MYTIDVWFPDSAFLGATFVFIGVYIGARIVWRLIPVVGG